MLALDGSHGEGGGQIVRTALALASLTGMPFRVTNIRAGRDAPGLKAQHVSCVNALQKLCGAVAEGAELGSRELTFYPKQIKGGTLEIDIGTAGSITLLLQAVLLPALFADKPTRMTIIGGTDVDFAMPIDYFSEILVPHIRPWCEKLEVKVLRRGYVPAGKGTVELFVKPSLRRSEFPDWSSFLSQLSTKVPPFRLLSQGTLVLIKGISHASQALEEARVAERQAHAAQAALAPLKADVKIRSEYAETASIGSGITLAAVFSKNKDYIDTTQPVRLGADALGRKGLPAETVGKQAADALTAAIGSGAPVDKHLADNLVPFLALAGGSMHVEEITPHTRTNIAVVHSFLGDVLTLDETKKTITRSTRA